MDQLLTINDTMAPDFISSSFPEDVFLQCRSDPRSSGDLGFPTATDNCVDVTVTESDDVTNGTCPNRLTVERTFAAEDICGNQVSRTREF